MGNTSSIVSVDVSPSQHNELWIAREFAMYKRSTSIHIKLILAAVIQALYLSP